MEENILSLYGLSNAVTRQSVDISNYDCATELEAISYDMLAMPRQQWDRLNQGAAKPFSKGGTLLIFNAIQARKRAPTSLKYFCKNTPEYHIIAADSLLSVALKRKQ